MGNELKYNMNYSRIRLTPKNNIYIERSEDKRANSINNAAYDKQQIRQFTELETNLLTDNHCKYNVLKTIVRQTWMTTIIILIADLSGKQNIDNDELSNASQ